MSNHFIQLEQSRINDGNLKGKFKDQRREFWTDKKLLVPGKADLLPALRKCQEHPWILRFKRVMSLCPI
jgi:hypothetical protein